MATRFVVWGNYQGQEEGEEWAVFQTLASAERYQRRTMKLNPGVILHISVRPSREDAPLREAG